VRGAGVRWRRTVAAALVSDGHKRLIVECICGIIQGIRGLFKLLHAKKDDALARDSDAGRCVYNKYSHTSLWRSNTLNGLS
jgi:hypothetical protein